MKRCVLVILVASFLVVAGVGRPVQGYGSAGHVYIVEHALFTLSANALYGAMAPDVIGYLPAPYRDLLEPNHVYFNLIPKAVTLPEKMFALGWMTHNQLWGGDYFAHVTPGYAVEQGDRLVAMLDLGAMPNASGVGHLAVEIAVDVLLQKQDPLLAMKMYQAAALRSQSIPKFLWQAGVLPDEKLAMEGEAFFRQMTQQYALAVGASSARNLRPMAQFASAMASEAYGMTITVEQAEGILGAAMALCKHTYLAPVNASIEQVRYHVWRGDF